MSAALEAAVARVFLFEERPASDLPALREEAARAALGSAQAAQAWAQHGYAYEHEG